MQDLFTSLLPTKIQAVAGICVGVTGTVFSHILGAVTPQLQALAAMVVLDYLTGVLAAYINPNLSINSDVGLKGICKKSIIFMVVGMCMLLDWLTGQNIFGLTITWTFIGNESVSILENAGKAGLPIPENIKGTLEKLTKGEIKK